MANTPNQKKQVIHKSGYSVLVGGESRWFRTEEAARKYFDRNRRQLGDALVLLTNCETDETLAGRHS